MKSFDEAANEEQAEMNAKKEQIKHETAEKEAEEKQKYQS